MKITNPWYFFQNSLMLVSCRGVIVGFILYSIPILHYTKYLSLLASHASKRMLDTNKYNSNFLVDTIQKLVMSNFESLVYFLFTVIMCSYGSYRCLASSAVCVYRSSGCSFLLMLRGLQSCPQWSRGDADRMPQGLLV